MADEKEVEKGFEGEKVRIIVLMKLEVTPLTNSLIKIHPSEEPRNKYLLDQIRSYPITLNHLIQF